MRSQRIVFVASAAAVLFTVAGSAHARVSDPCVDDGGCGSGEACYLGVCFEAETLECESDNDCGQCGHGQGAAHACHAHKCSECSSTYACPAGFTCSANGTCETECGDHGTGECQTDADCAGCGQDVGLVCHVPINGGTGQCGPEANGCSDLGNGAVVLPSPYDQVTNLCSNDGDCNGIGVEINVGKMLRDLTGIALDDQQSPTELLLNQTVTDSVQLRVRGGIAERLIMTVSAAEHRGRALYVVVMRLIHLTAQSCRTARFPLEEEKIQNTTGRFP